MHNAGTFLAPAGLLVAVVGVVGYLSYAMPQGPWYVAVYPQQGGHAFAQAAAHAQSVVADTPRSAAIFVSHADQKQALEDAGAILLDPQGVPTCYNLELTKKTQR